MKQSTMHRIDCINGRSDKQTQVMYPNVCNVLVASDGHFFRGSDKQRFKLKDYQDAYPHWYIPPGKTIKSALYWKWFICKHKAKLLEYYEAKSIKYPIAWQEIDKATIVRDLHSVYRLN